MWNCLIVLKRKDSLRIFVVKFFEIFFFIILDIAFNVEK